MNTQQLETFVLERMAKTKLSAVSMALIDGDQIVWSRGFGLRDREQGLPATAQTNYNIGSVTKTFTAVAIMQLQERGLLSIEDPVSKYLDLRLQPFGEPIRIRHLLSHTSGLPATAYLENLLRYHHGRSDKFLPLGTLQDMLSFLNGAEDWIETRPGERWFYFNEGYVLLGAIIEQLSGKAYAEYIREEILLPLGLTRSFHAKALAQQDPEMAVPYGVEKEGRHVAKQYPWGQAEPDGGLISNVADLARYVQFYLKKGEPLLKADSIAQMATPWVRTPNQTAAGEPIGHYGLGLSQTTLFGQRLFGHTGEMYVATAGMRILPERKLGAVVLANGSGYSMATFADFGLATLLGEDPWQLPALRTERLLEGLTGRYETYRGTFGCEVLRKGDTLQLVFTTKFATETVPLVPQELGEESSRFLAFGGGARQIVEFHHRAAGTEMLYERYKMRRVGPLAE
ncbi:MAG TPA: serine hydrolase [Symbiobacteriaceae bacterium]|nr:serine hydrolase [Symbiobacteriaceae bacterium]